MRRNSVAKFTRIPFDNPQTLDGGLFKNGHLAIFKEPVNVHFTQLKNGTIVKVYNTEVFALLDASMRPMSLHVLATPVKFLTQVHATNDTDIVLQCYNELFMVRVDASAEKWHVSPAIQNYVTFGISHMYDALIVLHGTTFCMYKNGELITTFMTDRVPALDSVTQTQEGVIFGRAGDLLYKYTRAKEWLSMGGSFGSSMVIMPDGSRVIGYDDGIIKETTLNANTVRRQWVQEHATELGLTLTGKIFLVTLSSVFLEV